MAKDDSSTVFAAGATMDYADATEAILEADAAAAMNDLILETPATDAASSAKDNKYMSITSETVEVDDHEKISDEVTIIEEIIEPLNESQEDDTATDSFLLRLDAVDSNLRLLPLAAAAAAADEEASIATTAPTPSAATPSRPGLLSLTQDSLHCIASFLTPLDWCRGFGETNKAAAKLCHEITSRVRLHGFRCAQEVVTAWKLGQLEDAKELAALYISSGVPIYPRSLGHSYHTVVWKLGLEAKQLLWHDEGSGEPSNAAAMGACAAADTVRESNVDPFYRERTEFRLREGRQLPSYLSEKCLFYMDKKENTSLSEDGRSTRSNTAPSPHPPLPQSVVRTVPRKAPQCKGSWPEKDFRPTIQVRVHQHLLDQHKQVRPCVDDGDGTMMTPPISLSADFFHAFIRKQQRLDSSMTITLPELEPLVHSHDEDLNETVDAAFHQALRDNGYADLDRAHILAADDLADGHNFMLGDAELDRQRLLLLREVNAMPRAQLNDVLSRTDLEIYSSLWTSTSKKNEAEGVQEMKRHLRSRFATYHRRLETFLSQKDLVSFDNCIMDFWDEFFPHSAGIHYFDRHTVVPRISCLSKFLTRPVPKSFGIVQCEIERIVTGIKGKAASMKGRFFPTYEYRLFIRHRPLPTTSQETAPAAEEDEPIRRDTVLMVAKYRGRKHSEATVVPMSVAAKKGANNYYLYLPQQSDVDAHFNEVNELERPAKLNSNGASQLPVILSDESYSSLLGRLQSNFIGTEFQIFTPHARKRPRRVTNECSFAPCSEDELESESGFSSDNNSTRRSRFSRLSLRRTNSSSYSLTDNHLPVINDSDASRLPRSSPSGSHARPGHRRSSSCPDVPYPRHARASRRVANDPDWKPEGTKTYILEEEDGCITYTANLLGSRPRIMDVCIPKVETESNQCIEWKHYLSNSEDLDECKMLNCFRQVLQRLENPSQPPGPHEETNQDLEVDRDVYIPPEDFGLMPLQNRPPWWNVELGSFVLNFGGRVSVASVKNFQLCDRNDHDKILLQFGRIQGRHSFTMDFQHPLTAVQAFSIAISSLQSKISFG